jgi:hypothetical protein
MYCERKCSGFRRVRRVMCSQPGDGIIVVIMKTCRESMKDIYLNNNKTPLLLHGFVDLYTKLNKYILLAVLVDIC